MFLPVVCKQWFCLFPYFLFQGNLKVTSEMQLKLHWNTEALHLNKIVLCEFGLTRLVIQTIRNANKTPTQLLGSEMFDQICKKHYIERQANTEHTRPPFINTDMEENQKTASKPPAAMGKSHSVSRLCLSFSREKDNSGSSNAARSHAGYIYACVLQRHDGNKHLICG